MKKMSRTRNYLVTVFTRKILRLIGHQLGAKVVAAAQRQCRNRDGAVHARAHLFQSGIAFVRIQHGPVVAERCREYARFTEH